MSVLSHNPILSDSPPTESTTYEDARADARAWSTDQLLAAIEAVHLDIADPLGDMDQVNARDRLRAFDGELQRRVRIFTMPDSRAAKYAADREEWAALAREVRQRVDIAEVLHMVGYPPRQIGREWHGGCPACAAGDDRLLVRVGPEGRCWCRRCDWRGDVIAVVRSFVPGHSAFRDALVWLTRLASMNVEVK